jgi:hypothetical protein
MIGTDYITVAVIDQPRNYRGTANWVRVLGHLHDHHGDEIHRWVVDNQLGVRSSFDTWVIPDEAGVTAFILRWQNQKLTHT